MKLSLTSIAVLPCALILGACGGGPSSDPSATAFQEGLAITTQFTPHSVIGVSQLGSKDLRPITKYPTYIPTTVVIDDFTVSQPAVDLIDFDQTTYQSGPPSKIVGGVRKSHLNVKSSLRPTKLAVDEGGPLFIDADWRSYWAVELHYGYGEKGAIPLNLSMIPYSRIRFSFEALDAAVDYSISLTDGDGRVAYSEGIQSTSSVYDPFPTDFVLASMHAPAEMNWDDIDAIDVSFYTRSPVGGSDVALTSIVLQQ